jgi:hypothetical protein
MASFRGINMFAMLVGKLPFKVKPFNLKKLYQKMINGDMEVLPTGTSQGRGKLGILGVMMWSGALTFTYDKILKSE